MKVLCIDASSINVFGHDTGRKSGLVEGEVYTVIGQRKLFGIMGYFLEEAVAPNDDGHYRSNRFIPCSDIDELELVKEKLETA